MDAYALPPKEGHIWQVSTGIKRNPALQLQALVHLAGTGSQPHRHQNARHHRYIRQMADAQGQVSPRSFPAAFRQVVEDSAQYCRKYGSALHPATIRDRIRQAAPTRVQEIFTPHPWVRLVFSVLKASPLPWTWDEVVHHWQTAFPVGPAGLPVTHLPFPRTQRGWSGVRDARQRLGILYVRSDGQPDVPELHRLEFGFLRRHYPLQFEFHFEFDFLYPFIL